MAIYKKQEKFYAEHWGGTRVGVTGLETTDVTGVFNGKGVVECKARKSIPKLLKDAMDQVVKHCKNGELPIVAIHENNKSYLNDFVVMRLRDFDRFFLKFLMEGCDGIEETPEPDTPSTLLLVMENGHKVEIWRRNGTKEE